jgi:allantoate deiminase
VKRIESYINELATIGRTPQGGVDRPLYTDSWAAAREQIATWMREIGLTVHSDAVGNLFGRLEGEEAGVVMAGSHFDTVRNGGPLDGALGIIGALVAVESLAQGGGRPRRSIEVYAGAEEESSRFVTNYWSSRAITGAVGPEEAASHLDAEGVSIGEAMRSQGLDPARIPSARRTDIHAFLELHIEQGRLLYDEGIPVGIVSAITGQHRVRVAVTGRADHAGTTPMDLRRDAFLGAAEMALGIAETAERLGRPAVATVGSAVLSPGAINVVPGETVFTIDMRHPDAGVLASLVASVHDLCSEVATRRGLDLTWTPYPEVPPQPLDESLVALLQSCATEMGIAWKPMVSGAGHDAQIIARAFPAGMIFVPSVEGRSHTPDEFTPIDAILPGVRLLAEAIRRLAY